MKLQLPVRKQTLRLILGMLALTLPVVLTLSLFLISSDSLVLSSITSHLRVGMRPLAIFFFLIFSFVFVLYAVTYRQGRLTSLTTAVFLLIIVGLLPSYDVYVNAWTRFIQQLIFVLFLALLGWHIRFTFNLPLGFRALTKIGTVIWVLDVLLLIWLIAFQSVWPPFGFILETIILWLFTAGIYIRHQINKKLGG